MEDNSLLIWSVAVSAVTILIIQSANWIYKAIRTVPFAKVFSLLCCQGRARKGAGAIVKARNGRTLDRAQAVLLWKTAGRYVIRLLRLRFRWHNLGGHLQRPRIQDLLKGIERKRGVVTRAVRLDEHGRVLR